MKKHVLRSSTIWYHDYMDRLDKIMSILSVTTRECTLKSNKSEYLDCMARTDRAIGILCNKMKELGEKIA